MSRAGRAETVGGVRLEDRGGGVPGAQGWTRRAWLRFGAVTVLAWCVPWPAESRGRGGAAPGGLPGIRVRPLVRQDLYRAHSWAG